MIDEDTIQRIKVCGIFLIEIYKITTGTLTSLFIPQSCGDHVCTLQENLNQSDLTHRSLLYWNFITMTMFYMYYFVELRREEWAIEYLDIDNDKPDNGLKELIRKEPKLDKKMDKLNLLYYRTLKSTCILYSVNGLMTCSVLRDRYYNNSTLSCFLSFSLLVIHKLYNSYCVATQSVHEDKMMSSYMSEFVSFNIIDKDYKRETEKHVQP